MVAFGAQRGLRGAEGLEFEELAATVHRLLTSPPRPRTEGRPIRIQVLDEEGSLVCRLEATETARVEALHGHPRDRVAIRAAHDVVEDFERLYGDVGPELAHLVTGLTREQLLAAGGVEFVDAQNDRVLRRWPLPRA